MKMLSFFLGSMVVGAIIAWFFFINKEEREEIWNSKTRLTILILFGTIFMFFAAAIISSMFTVKLF